MTTTARSTKPLGGKCYGSIPHLPNSRIGPGDHHCHDGQYRICCKQVRDRHDTVIVQEKVDGSNVGVANIDGVIWPLTRAGYHANTSPYEQHHLFAGWVQRNYERFDFLQPGERVCGEWLAQAHATRYTLAHEPLVVFDLIGPKGRATYAEMLDRIGDRFRTPTVLQIVRGGCCSLAEALELLGEFGHHGATDPAEGVVYRVERRGAFDFLAKYVRPEKKDGVYLPEISGQPAVWNWRP